MRIGGQGQQSVGAPRPDAAGQDPPLDDGLHHLSERAKAALVAGDAAAAAQDARQVLQQSPGAWPALYLLAVAGRQNGRRAADRGVRRGDRLTG